MSDARHRACVRDRRKMELTDQIGLGTPTARGIALRKWEHAAGILWPLAGLRIDTWTINLR